MNLNLSRSFVTLGILAVAGCTASQDLGSTHQAPAGASAGSGAGSPNAADDAGGGTFPSSGAQPTTKAVLFGGFDGVNGIQGAGPETWTFDGAHWTRESPSTAPTARAFAAGAALGGKVVMYGGALGPTEASDTWLWDGTSWTPSAATGPKAKSHAALSAFGSSLVLYGSSGLDDTDVWLFDGSGWTMSAFTGPLNPMNWSGVANGTGGLLFGNDTLLAWDGSTFEARAQGTGPTIDEGASLAMLGQTLVLFGGHTQTNDLADTWTWDGTNWTKRNVQNAPSPRAYAGMASVGDKVVLFGGCSFPSFGEPTCNDETWIWDGATWTQLDVPGPSARAPGIFVGY